MVPFLAQSVEDITRSFSSMFLLKDTLNKSNICLLLSKHGQNVDPGISVKMEHADWKKNGKASDNQILKSKRDIVSFCQLYVPT